MPKKDNETFIEFKTRVMDSISPSYCAAKWYNASIWLADGETASCHSPLAHSIDLNEIKQDPSALHNTFIKKVERKLMLQGKRPQGCDSCWVVEDVGDDKIVSDRVYKTEIYTQNQIETSHTGSRPFDNFIPTNLEVSFESTCNLACSYCNPLYSSKWAQDIHSNGDYENLIHSDKKKINIVGKVFEKGQNPYINAFWNWWPDLIKELKEFRISGGEPLLSEHVWDILERFKDDKLKHIKLAINTNLSTPDKLIDKLIKASHEIKTLDIYTSCESKAEYAEYIRDGLQYTKFLDNCRKLIKNGNISSLNMMMTISSLSLFSLTDFLDDLVKIKEEFNCTSPTWTVNILRFPAFMSPLVLPRDLREKIHTKLNNWIRENKQNKLITEIELESIYRLAEFLVNGKTIHSEAKVDREVLEHDFKMFYTQYDKRRGKSIEDVFPLEFTQWYRSIGEK